jgi:hypothetical protein
MAGTQRESKDTGERKPETERAARDLRRRLRVLQAYLNHPFLGEWMTSDLMVRLLNGETEFTKRETNEVMEFIENEMPQSLEMKMLAMKIEDSLRDSVR